MRILGICHDVLICSAALTEGGRVVAAVPEERLDRVKQSRVFPARAIAWCLARGKLALGDVDEIAVAWNPAIEAETAPSAVISGRRWRTEHFASVPTRFLQSTRAPASEVVSLTGLWQDAPPITYVDHYMAHLGNAVFLSPFEECAVAILDGRAERKTGLLARVRGTEIQPLKVVDFPHSIGLVYGAVTQYLGFKPDSDEWKVMALAAYARSDNEYLEPMRRLLVAGEDGGFHVQLDAFQYYNFWDARMYSDAFVASFGPPRSPDAPLEPRHERIAAALQRVFEEVVTKILVNLYERTRLRRLCVSGGCFMNSVFNGKLTSVTPFDEVFITSCPDDSGTSIGAALYLDAQRTGTRPAAATAHHNFGPAYSDEECLAAVHRFKLPHEVLAHPAERAARDLVDGQLIGWFQGPGEFGQRALGNRSILADPRRADARDLVNAAVKYRESFRPFAPAILAEHVAEWFECAASDRVPFMERVFAFRPEKRALVPAVVHVDGSGRLQTVDEHSSPRYRELITAFRALTGVPLVLNTSFNLNGEPMVSAPEDAVRTFFSCGLDTLYLGNVRVTKAR